MGGHYEVESVLGKGAMGVVHLARDTRIGRRVALKTVKVSSDRFESEMVEEEFFTRLQREAELCGAMHHPNIVTLYEAGYENGRIAFLAMEYIDGESLMHVLRNTSPLSVDAALRITADVLQGLSYAHRQGITHRDVKPANILITRDGAAKITDFGIARPAESSLTVSGQVLGTPLYMAPENVTGKEVTPRSDLFSVGSMLYEMLTGNKPFSGADLHSILFRVVTHDPQPITDFRSDVTPELVEFLGRLMKKSPDERFPSADAALEALSEITGVKYFTAPAPVVLGAHSKAPDETPTTPITSPLRTMVDVTPRSLSVAGEKVGQVGNVSPAAARTESDLPRQVRAQPPGKTPAKTWSTAAMSIAAAVITLLLAAVIGVTNEMRTEQPASVVPERAEEYAKKRDMMTRAREAFDAGRYSESLSLYEEVLAAFPNTPAAIEGRTLAQEKVAALSPSSSTANVTAKKSRPPAKKAAQESKKKRFIDRLFFWRD